MESINFTKNNYSEYKVNYTEETTKMKVHPN